MKFKVLAVDDDENILSLITDILEQEGFAVITANNTDDGFEKSVKSQPDVIILDVKMPRIGGIELCRKLREEPKTKNIPIMMLTVESSETDKVIGLEIGADDYVVKPFSKKEFVARIRALLRRSKNLSQQEQKIKFDNVEIDPITRTVTVDNKEVYFTAKEFDLLYLLVSKPGVVFTRQQILESVFGYHVVVESRTVDTHIKNIRKKLGKYGDKIETVYSVGFKFTGEIHSGQ